MSNLDKNTVLVLNRNWQAIGVKNPMEAFCMLATDVASPLDIGKDEQGNDYIVPVKFSEWVALPVRDGDCAISTPRGQMRIPTVIIAVNYAKVPMKRPKFGASGIWKRDRGECAYTGRKLRPGEGNIDHVVPRSRGGATSWENCVLAHKDVNTRKGSKTPAEAGLRLRNQPSVPKPLPASSFIENHHGVADWERFLSK